MYVFIIIYHLRKKIAFSKIDLASYRLSSIIHQTSGCVYQTKMCRSKENSLVGEPKVDRRGKKLYIKLCLSGSTIVGFGVKIH